MIEEKMEENLFDLPKRNLIKRFSNPITIQSRKQKTTTIRPKIDDLPKFSQFLRKYLILRNTNDFFRNIEVAKARNIEVAKARNIEVAKAFLSLTKYI